MTDYFLQTAHPFLPDNPKPMSKHLREVLAKVRVQFDGVEFSPIDAVGKILRPEYNLRRLFDLGFLSRRIEMDEDLKTTVFYTLT